MVLHIYFKFVRRRTSRVRILYTLVFSFPTKPNKTLYTITGRTQYGPIITHSNLRKTASPNWFPNCNPHITQACPNPQNIGRIWVGSWVWVSIASPRAGLRYLLNFRAKQGIRKIGKLIRSGPVQSSRFGLVFWLRGLVLDWKIWGTVFCRSVPDYTSRFKIGPNSDHMQLRLYSYHTPLIHTIISLIFISYTRGICCYEVVAAMEFCCYCCVFFLFLYSFVMV